jgi:penicillin-binding protein 2
MLREVRRPEALGGLPRRIALLSVLITVAFVVLFWRLWFLQVLASESFNELARENRVRIVRIEAPRGRILDRDGEVLVANRILDALTVERSLLERPRRARRVLRRLAAIVDTPARELRERLKDPTASPYAPLVIAEDLSAEARYRVLENKQDLPGVEIRKLPIREYPQGALAAHVLGYVGEISSEQLRAPVFRSAAHPYRAGDLVGKAGLELAYERWLRGTDGRLKVIVDSEGKVIARREVTAPEPGRDLILSLDADVQRTAEAALAAGLRRSQGVGGAVTVLDPATGAVVAMASLPDYDPSVLADGISHEEFRRLNRPSSSAFFNRALQGERSPGSTFKVVTAGAALSNGILDPSGTVACPGAATYPPSAVSGSVTFNNWTAQDNGNIDIPRSLEISCDTFYYELGWRLEARYGVSSGGDGTERFQRYIRRAGFGHETGIDLPNEADGRVPDLEWCRENAKLGYCPDGWVPGYTINMSIGQGDLVVTPTQLAVTYGALANGGKVLEPRVGARVAEGRRFDTRVANTLPLEASELAVIEEGLTQVVSGAEGTARAAFAGFPLARYPVAGKTGTAETSDGKINDAWFAGYAPAHDPRYVVSVYLERTKGFHGGEVAAPVARQILEEVFGIDGRTDVHLGRDGSG